LTGTKSSVKAFSISKGRTGSLALKISVTLIMAFVGAVIVFPFYAMTMMSTYSTAQIFRGIVLWPGDFFMENVRTLMRINFVQYYINSIYLALTTGVLSVFCSAMGGYALGVYNFKGKKYIMALILVTLTLPFQIALIGIVMQANFMNMADTHSFLILIGIPSAFGVFWMSAYARQAIPQSCIESAHIDGCSDFMTFIKIGLPFMMPACGTLFLLVFLGSWNSFVLPTILLSRDSLFTLPIGIRLLANNFGADLGAQLAGLVLGTFPILIVFASFSKTLIQGLSASAVKE